MATILPINYGEPIMINFHYNNVKVEFFSNAKILNVILELNNIINLDYDISVYKGIFSDLLDINTKISNNNFILKIPIDYSKKLEIHSSGKVTIENVDTDIDMRIYSKKVNLKNIEILRKGSILLKYCYFLDGSKVTLEVGNIDLFLEKGIHTKRNFEKNYLEIKKDRQCIATILTANGKVKIKKKG